MPYIKGEERREEFDESIDKLVDSVSVDGRAGDLNYIITNLLVLSLGGEGNYKLHNENLGVLDAVAREYYRRLVAPYENKKIEENGDVRCYKK